MIFNTTNDFTTGGVAKVTKGQFSLSGIQNTISNFFAPQTYDLSEVLSQEDIDCIKKYNDEYTKLSQVQEKSQGYIRTSIIANKAYERTMTDASKTAQDYVKQQEAGTVALEGLTKSSKAAELATKALATAGNMLISLAVSAVISAVIKGIDSYVHRLDNAIDAMSESHSNYLQLEEDITSLNDELTTTQDRIIRISFLK